MKPALIYSKILNEIICISDEEVPNCVSYSKQEVNLLKEIETNMEWMYPEFLRKIHLVKRVFRGSRIIKYTTKGENNGGEKEKGPVSSTISNSG